MGNVDHTRFERRGARGCSNSDYHFCRTECCGRWCVEDVELSDLYIDGRNLTQVSSLLVEPGHAIRCPFCGSNEWDFRAVEDLSDVPEEWRWALEGAIGPSLPSDHPRDRPSSEYAEHPQQGVLVMITRYVDDSFPGFVECKLTDATGTVWTFVEKVPVVTLADLDASSTYPQPAILACRIVERRRDPGGREVATIDTSTPWGIESTSGDTRFDVRAEQLENIDWP